MTWWLWNASITERDGLRRPFYGLMIQTHQDVGFGRSAQIDLPSGAVLRIDEKVISDIDAEPLLLIDRSEEIDLSTVFLDVPKIPVKMRRRILADAFGHVSMPVDCAYGLPEPGDLFPSREDVATIIDTCVSELKLPFSGDFASHLGGFDLFRAPLHLDSTNPIRIELIRETDIGSYKLRVWRGELSTRPHIVCVRTKEDSELTCAFAKNMEASIEPYDVPLSGGVDGYELTLFDAVDASLVHYEERYIIREVRSNMSFLARTIVHKDSLVNKAAAHGETAVRRAQATNISHATHTRTVFDPTGLRAHTQALHIFLRGELGEQTQDRWMPSTFNAQLEVIDYLNTLMGGDTQEAILVDPFFGEKALQEFLLRLSHAGLDLTVVTSWGRTDPDTGKRTPGGKETALLEAQRRLAPLLRRIFGHIAPRLKLVNLVTSSGYQAFHDRYLFVRSHNGENRVFLLSNSINGIAADWPFCISLLTGRAALDAIRYIQGLSQGYDDTQATTLKVSYQWPELYASSAPP